ncbi:hypothetical protein HGB24_02480 [Candidatus Saccharibacteria bacterium]|nr:hypothetical protein [Candidatus Saccharibacteria bacterium]
MEDNKVLKLVYTFFVGILLATFIGVGINTFYEPPQYPEYPSALNAVGEKMTAEQTAIMNQYDSDMADYNDKMVVYNRIVSIIALAFAVVILAVSIAFENRIKFLSDGVMLGGLFTLIYGIGRGFATDDSKYIFVTVTVGLAVVIYLGYHRFVSGHAQKSDAKTK